MTEGDTSSLTNETTAVDSAAELAETLRRLEKLLTRFEIDTAARLHVVDYQATIAQLCDRFQEHMRKLAHE